MKTALIISHQIKKQLLFFTVCSLIALCKTGNHVLQDTLHFPSSIYLHRYVCIKMEFHKHTKYYVVLDKEIWTNLTFMVANQNKGNYNF